MAEIIIEPINNDCCLCKFRWCVYTTCLIDMKSGNKKTSVLMLLIFPSKMLLGIKGSCFRYMWKKSQKILELQESLLKTARRNFL